MLTSNYNPAFLLGILAGLMEEKSFLFQLQESTIRAPRNMSLSEADSEEVAHR